MNKLDELIKELCPNGVEYKELGELGIFENIGVDKKINVNEKEILLLNYTDIYKNNYIDSSIPKMIVTANDKKIENCSVEECDIFITPTSETKEDIGHASVILETIPNCCYSYHIMRYRLINPNRVTASFIMYLFYSQDLKRQILKYAQGLTRYGLSKEKFSNLLIPFPNIRIQEEIVKVLDDYTKSVEELKGKLNEELTARKKQYSWYRDYLLKFENKVEMVKLGSIGKVSMCRRILKSETNIVGGIPFFKIGTFGKKEDAYISIEKFNEYKEKYSYPKKGMVLISTSGTIGRTIVFDGKPAYYQDSNIVWIDNNEEKVLNKYLYYFYQTSPWKIDMGGTIERLYNENIEKTIIPLPPLEVQKRDFTEDGVGCIHYGQIYTKYGMVAEKTISFVEESLAEKLRKVEKGNIIFAVTSENIEDLCKCVVWLGEEEIVTGGHTAILKHNQNSKFLAYYFQTEAFHSQKRKLATGTKVMDITATKLEEILVPLPPLEEQQRIVDILDRFDKLCNDISEGLPAEIEARQKQYEYYREKLLSFKKL